MTETHDVAIIGAGPIGLELAVAFKQFGIDYIQIDAGQIGSTIAWYPGEMLFHSSSDRLGLAGVPIQTATQQKITREEYLAYLRALVMQFGLQVRSYERVTQALRRRGGGFELVTRALDGEHRYRVEHVVLAIGAFHAPRMLDIPGEELPHVSHYFHDPHTYFAKKLLIVGGRNSSVEAAVRCQRAGADVTLSYRRDDFDPKVVKFWLLPEVRALIRDSRIRYLPRTTPIEIGNGTVLLAPVGDDAPPLEIDADFVLLLTGYRQDSMLFDQLGVELRGDDRQPVYDPETMETNVPGVFVAGTAVAGTPPRKVTVIVETCHVHIPRIVAAIQGKRVALPDGALDE
ncbi:MAG TPA: NAD(P)-binding domain-containing protein [Thermoanaerobaculia bacterium]|jgi:thioredoxin reductase (NADPH)|nr:NAD(P)-binding domain-containing protein [Thermoanaerobaculia bacterium]